LGKKVKLYDSANNQYACSLLDACLYLKKLEEADGCVSVLDQEYKSQQLGTLFILNALNAGGYTLNTEHIFPFFYSAPETRKHPIVDSSLIFAEETSVDPMSFVQPSLELAKIVSQLSCNLDFHPSLKESVLKDAI